MRLGRGGTRRVRADRTSAGPRRLGLPLLALPPARAGAVGQAGIAYSLASPLFLALVPILISAGLRQGSDTIGLVTVRTAVAAVFAWSIIGVASGFSGLRGGWSREPLLVAGGVAGFALGPLAGYYALGRIDATAYIAIYYLHVPLIALLLPLLGLEQASRRAFASAAVCSLGVGLAMGATHPETTGVTDPIGLALAALATSGTALLAIAFHRAGARLNPARLNAEFMTVSTVFFAVLLTARGAWGAIDGATLGIGAAIAITAWLPGRLFWTYAVREVGARTAGIFGSLQPGLVALLGYTFLHDHFGPERWIGVALVCAGVASLYLRRLPPRLTSDPT